MPRPCFDRNTTIEKAAAVIAGLYAASLVKAAEAIPTPSLLELGPDNITRLINFNNARYLRKKRKPKETPSDSGDSTTDKQAMSDDVRNALIGGGIGAGVGGLGGLILNNRSGQTRKRPLANFLLGAGIGGGLGAGVGYGIGRFQGNDTQTESDKLKAHIDFAATATPIERAIAAKKLSRTPAEYDKLVRRDELPESGGIFDWAARQSRMFRGGDDRSFLGEVFDPKVLGYDAPSLFGGEGGSTVPIAASGAVQAAKQFGNARFNRSVIKDIELFDKMQAEELREQSRKAFQMQTSRNAEAAVKDLEINAVEKEIKRTSTKKIQQGLTARVAASKGDMAGEITATFQAEMAAERYKILGAQEARLRAAAEDIRKAPPVKPVPASDLLTPDQRIRAYKDTMNQENTNQKQRAMRALGNIGLKTQLVVPALAYAANQAITAHSKLQAAEAAQAAKAMNTAQNLPNISLKVK